MARFLVTGGCGFIGSHLVDSLLRSGDDVVVLDDLSTGSRENIPSVVPLIVADVGNSTAVRECMRNVDGCFHLAAIASVQKSIEDWPGTNRVNLGGTINVLDAAKSRGSKQCPVVLASSAAVYGSSEKLPLRESGTTRPISAYGVDKLSSEMHGAVAASTFGVPVTALRFFNVYGPRQDPRSPYSGVISIFADRVSSGKPVTIYGDGQQCRDFVFVEDVVKFLRGAMQTSCNGFRRFNVCTGQPTTLLELISILVDITGQQVDFELRSKRPGDIYRSVGDPSSAIKTLGIRAEASVSKGLHTTLTSIGVTRNLCAASSE